MSGTALYNRRTLGALLGAAVLLAFFWYPTLMSRFSSLDELSTFIRFSKTHDMSQLMGFLLRPHNQHFAPVFKLAFFAEYSMFGMSPSPYHAVSIGLFLLSAGLLWKFIMRETGDSAAAALCSLAYATNSVYFSVVSWVFAQQIILAFIFMELAFLSLQGSLGRLSVCTAAMFCLLASLCLNYGSVAWLFCAIYLYFRDRRDKRTGSLRSRAGLSDYCLLLVSAALTVSLYASFYVDTSAEYGSVHLAPFIYMKGIPIFIGNSMLRSLGLHRIAIAAADSAGASNASLYAGLKLLSLVVFFSAAAMAAIYHRRLSHGGRMLASSSFAIAVLSAIAIIGARADFYDHDMFRLASIGRYSFFPLAFFTIGAAPYLSLIPTGRRQVLLLLLPVWILVHVAGLRDGLASKQHYVALVDKSMHIAKKSLDHPVEMDEEGNVYITDMVLSGSRPVEDFSILPGGHVTNLDMMGLYLGSHDLLSRAGEKTLLLRNSLELGPGDIRKLSEGAHMRWEGNEASITGSSQIALRLDPPPSVLSPGGHYVLSFMSSSDHGGIGSVVCTGKGYRKAGEFEISGSFFSEAHRINIPCARPGDAFIFLPEGEYTLHEIRLHW